MNYPYRVHRHISFFCLSKFFLWRFICQIYIFYKKIYNTYIFIYYVILYKNLLPKFLFSSEFLLFSVSCVCNCAFVWSDPARSFCRDDETNYVLFMLMVFVRISACCVTFPLQFYFVIRRCFLWNRFEQ